MKVCHITTVHQAFDTRIFFKECTSLANNGFDTYLIVRSDEDQVVNGVNILALPNLAARGWRRLVNAWRAFVKALSVKADVYHFHDPELLGVGMALRLITRAQIIYDAHEDVKLHAMSKAWMGRIAQQIVGSSLRVLEILGTPFSAL